jgi:hypothetical protein
LHGAIPTRPPFAACRVPPICPNQEFTIRIFRHSSKDAVQRGASRRAEWKPCIAQLVETRRLPSRGRLRRSVAMPLLPVSARVEATHSKGGHQ